MKKNSTPLELSVITTKIISHTSLFVESERKIKYELLNQNLQEILNCIKPFVWLDMNSVSDIDYEKTVPIMANMIGWINDFDVEKKLHFWHYQEHNNFDKIDDMINLSENFLFFIKKELDIEKE